MERVNAAESLHAALGHPLYADFERFLADDPPPDTKATLAVCSRSTSGGERTGADELHLYLWRVFLAGQQRTNQTEQ